MILVLQLLFWISVAAVVHSYVIYPFLLARLANGKSNNKDIFNRSEELPYIIVLMSVHNEEKIIVQKLNSILQTNYPADYFEIIIGSDGSTDDTNAFVTAMAGQYDNIMLTEYEGRNGKANIINKLIDRYGNAIKSLPDCLLVMTDANVIFTENTFYELAKHFKNKEVGIVAANILNTNCQKTGISYQEKTYITRENLIKYHEGIVWGSMMGAFGACYAIRADLFSPIPPNFLMEDFFLTMSVLEKGKRAISEPAAICYEDIPDEIAIEFGRKKRISAGNYQNLNRFAALLWPIHKGVGFCFLSHKVLRWLGPFFIIIAFVTCAILAVWGQNNLYRYLLLTQIGLLALPLLDSLLLRANIYIHILRFISYFFWMNVALLAGFFQYLKGIKTNAWSPTKRSY